MPAQPARPRSARVEHRADQGEREDDAVHGRLSILRRLIDRAPGWQRLLPAAMLAGLAVAALLPAARHFFALDLPQPLVWLVIGVSAAISHGLFILTARLSTPASAPTRGHREEME